MNTLEVTRLPIDEADYIGKYAQESDVSHVISEDTIVLEDGKPIVLYKRTNWDLEPLRTALDHASLGTFTRHAKVSFESESASFGFSPRMPLFGRPCKISEFSVVNPDIMGLLEAWTEEITSVYRTHNPDIAQKHHDTAARVRSGYRIRDTMFTSGIINRSSQLPYHYDSGNFKGVWSAMLGMRKGVEGGYLNIPRYGIALEIADGSLSYFNGQDALHGVTPMRRTHPEGNRYTIVWYSIERMWQCLTSAEEIALANQRNTRMNRKKAGKALKEE